jgi:hypothetical protein
MDLSWLAPLAVGACHGPQASCLRTWPRRGPFAPLAQPCIAASPTGSLQAPLPRVARCFLVVACPDRPGDAITVSRGRLESMERSRPILGRAHAAYWGWHVLTRLL